MSLQTRILFLAGTHREAAYWAKQWGFQNGEWRFVGNVPDALGLRNIDRGIVYVCGSAPIHPDLSLQLRAAGYDTFVDAHDLDTAREQRSALDLLS